MPRPNRVAICLYLILSLVLRAAPAATAQTYTITDLGTFPGGGVSQGQGINFLGQVAGYARFSNFNAHGFLWTTSHGLKDLGAIPPASHFSVGQAINIFGDVAGYSVYDQLLDEHAVLWRGGKLYDLGTLPGGTISFAYGIRSNRRAKTSGDGPVEVRAQMPGKVIKVLVAPGDTVEAGQGLVVVEAMKMQNEMKAPKGGKVARLHAREGATVIAGEPLVVVE